MSERTWTIVQFVEDSTVEAVPSTWIQGQTCHWPTYSREKLMTAIRKHEPLNTCWPDYQIRSFRNSTFGAFISNVNIYSFYNMTSINAKQQLM